MPEFLSTAPNTRQKRVARVYHRATQIASSRIKFDKFIEVRKNLYV
jgi:hypothetical protein